MRLLAIALLIPAAFLLGRATDPTVASAQSERQVYTLRQNDVVRAPAAATRCTASAEGGAKNLSHNPPSDEARKNANRYAEKRGHHARDLDASTEGASRRRILKPHFALFPAMRRERPSHRGFSAGGARNGARQ